MMMVQGSGDVNGEITTSPVCVSISKVTLAATKSSKPCAAAASAILSMTAGGAVSAAKC